MIPEISRRIAVESAPAALAFVCWAFVVQLAPPTLQTPLTLIALTLGLLYAGARGRALADAASPDPLEADARSFLAENLRAAAAAGVWLVAAALVYGLAAVWDLVFERVGAFTNPADWLASAFGGAALVAVVIYAVARWTAMERRGGTSTAPADD
ncbi:hypothetical protein [Halorarius halobius]|uniref:hypothetical protein n=1 Tax=Halorarius halobius TaxID=2962671 RepID=UPI0020CDDFDD|nr:hypothetical protein [Halorarius halobius]